MAIDFVTMLIDPLVTMLIDPLVTVAIDSLIVTSPITTWVIHQLPVSAPPRLALSLLEH